MPSTLADLVNRLNAASDGTRIRLLALLAQGERTVKELTEVLGQSQPRISRHLKVLAESALVTRSPEGSWVYYRLADGEGRTVANAILAELDRADPLLQRDRGRLEQIRRHNQDAADRFFAEHAASWDQIRSLHVPEKEVEAAILARVGEKPFRSLLDVGTGTGRMLELLATQYERALGVDLSPAMLAVARANLERAGVIHARVRIGESTNLPVVRDSFDLVLIHQVLHFLDDPAAAVAEAAAAVAPGGRLVIVDFAPHGLEFLREQQAHRRLGFAHAQVAQWIAATGLEAGPVEDLAPKARDGGLTVTLWTGRDARAAAAGREPAEARP